jgi:hypothetical protein
MERNVHEAAVAVRPHAWQTSDGCRIERAVADDPEPSGPLGDQHAPIGKKGDGPRMRQTLGNDGQADFVLFGCVEHERPCAQGRYRYAYPRLLGVADGDHAEQDEHDATNERVESHAFVPVTEGRRREYKTTKSDVGRPFSRDSSKARTV